MASIPVEVLYEQCLGILLGVVPMLVSRGLGSVFKYVTGVTVPGFGVVLLGVPIAGAGLIALNDPRLIGFGNQLRLPVALVVVLGRSLYAHAAGDRQGAALPRRVTLRSLADRTLSADVIERVGSRGQMTVAAEVRDVEGAPPLSPALRDENGDGRYTFPGDVPLPELDTRVEDPIRYAFDCSEVAVTLDNRSRVTVMAAPAVAGLSKRVPDGQHAVSVRALVPAGIVPSDELALYPPVTGG